MTEHLKSPLEVLPEDECWHLLSQRTVGRLAVVINNTPDIFPVNFKVWKQAIFLQTAPGLKLAAAVLNPSVAFEVDAVDEQREVGWSVVVRGTAIELERLDELLLADDLGVRPWAAGVKNRYLKIEPTSVTGRLLPGRPL